MDRVLGFRVMAMSVSEIVATQGIDIAVIGNRSPLFFETMAQLKTDCPKIRIVVTGKGSDDETILKATNQTLRRGLQALCGDSTAVDRNVLDTCCGSGVEKEQYVDEQVRGVIRLSPRGYLMCQKEIFGFDRCASE